MKCVCERNCQVRIRDQIVYVTKGEVHSFEKCPRNFRPLASTGLDFLTASEDEMRETDWSFAEAAKVIHEAYGAKLKKGTKEEVIDQIMDARYRNA